MLDAFSTTIHIPNISSGGQLVEALEVTGSALSAMNNVYLVCKGVKDDQIRKVIFLFTVLEHISQFAELNQFPFLFSSPSTAAGQFPGEGAGHHSEGCEGPTSVDWHQKAAHAD